MNVRALSKHSYSCYMLKLLPDGLGENYIKAAFSLVHRTASSETQRWRWERNEKRR